MRRKIRKEKKKVLCHVQLLDRISVLLHPWWIQWCAYLCAPDLNTNRHCLRASSSIKCHIVAHIPQQGCKSKGCHDIYPSLHLDVSGRDPHNGNSANSWEGGCLGKEKYQQHKLSKVYIEISRCQSLYFLLQTFFIQILFYCLLVIQDRTGCIEVLNYYLTERGSI